MMRWHCILTMLLHTPLQHPYTLHSNNTFSALRMGNSPPCYKYQHPNGPFDRHFSSKLLRVVASASLINLRLILHLHELSTLDLFSFGHLYQHQHHTLYQYFDTDTPTTLDVRSGGAWTTSRLLF